MNPLDYLSRMFPSLGDYLDIPFGDSILCVNKPQSPTNKDLRSSTNQFPKSLLTFSAGSNSTVNALRYLTPQASVATASGEPEDNVAQVFDYLLTLKRIRYIYGTNTKNGVTNISLRLNNADQANSVLAIQPATNGTFDSGVLNIDINPLTKINWKWDTTLSASGGITIIYFAELLVSLV